MVLVAAAAGPTRADNAADRYREAMAMLLPPAMGLGSPAGVLSIDDLDTLAFLPPVPTAADRERLAPILAKTAEARALLETASTPRYQPVMPAARVAVSSAKTPAPLFT